MTDRESLAQRYRDARARLDTLTKEVADSFWPWVKAATSREEARARIMATPDHVTACFMLDWFRREWPD